MLRDSKGRFPWTKKPSEIRKISSRKFTEHAQKNISDFCKKNWDFWSKTFSCRKKKVVKLWTFFRFARRKKLLVQPNRCILSRVKIKHSNYTWLTSDLMFPYDIFDHGNWMNEIFLFEFEKFRTTFFVHGNRPLIVKTRLQRELY